MAQNYADLMNQVLKEKAGSIEGIQKQINERSQMHNDWASKIDLAPGAAWIDAMTGSRLAPSMSGPSPYEKNQAVIGKLEEALQRQKDDYGDRAVSFFRDQQNQERMDLQRQDLLDQRKFDRWYKGEILKDHDLDRDARAAAARAKAKNKSFTADQTNAATFGKRALQAEAIFGALENEGYNRATRGESMSEWLPTEWQGESLRKQSQAERNFVNALLRRESGAAISSTEFDSAEQQYFPRPGDTPQILAQKRANRLQAIEGLRVGAGGAWDEVRYIDPTKEEYQPQNIPKAGMARLRKGDEIVDIPESDVNEAMAEGFERVY